MTPDEKLLVDANRFFITRSVAAGYAHQLRNSIQALGMAADGLAPGCIREDIDLLLPVLSTESDRAYGVLQSLAELVDRDGFEPGPLALDSVLRDACAAGAVMRPPGAVPEYSGYQGPIPPVRGSETGISLILLNLISNARWVTSDVADARIGVTVRVASDAVVVSVNDNGSGIPDDLGGDPFDPFVTSRAGARGIGLTAARIVAAGLGAAVSLHPATAGRGTTAEVSLGLWETDSGT